MIRGRLAALMTLTSSRRHVTLLKHPQQFDLDSAWQLRHRVKKDRPAIDRDRRPFRPWASNSFPVPDSPSMKDPGRMIQSGWSGLEFL